MSRSFWGVVADEADLETLEPGALRLRLRELAISSRQPDVGAAVRCVADGLAPAGSLTHLLEGPGVTDVLVNGHDEIWVERYGSLERVETVFSSADELVRLIEVLVGRAGGRVDATSPVADVRLPNGARLHVVLPPLAPGGPLLSLRRHSALRLPLTDLIDGSWPSGSLQDLRRLVAERRNIAIAGPTGSGKTTLLAALLAEVDPQERIVTVEETPEIGRPHPHVVSLIARPANTEGKGAVGLDALVVAALRMRPDRIVVGEVRGAEAEVALQAMATGHPGSMLTVHARSVEGALERLVALALRDPHSPSERTVRAALVASLDAIVVMERKSGTRRITEIAILR